MSKKEVKDFRKIPSVNRILQAAELSKFKDTVQQDLIKRIVTVKLNELRSVIRKGGQPVEENEVIRQVETELSRIFHPSLRPVINATGVVLHTNLGRAPLGEELLDSIKPVLRGYSNLEFNLKTAQRGSRNSHLQELLQPVINCEESVVVNNNAAALFLALTALAKGKEVIISRGELVEIGGSFRIPEIITESGAKLVEVGTTNKTRLSDYENAVTENTALYLKVHKSNYFIQGFTEEVNMKDLTASASKNGLKTIYDLGTGLLDKKLYKGLDNEPDVKTALKEGADIVTFSCDKILGGPQAGIAAGRKDLIDVLACHPLMRVLRVDKMTISALNSVFCGLARSQSIVEEINPVVRYLNRSEVRLTELAGKLAKKLNRPELIVSVIDNKAQCGGGTLPYHYIDSKAVTIRPRKGGGEESKTFAEKLYHDLLSCEQPVLGILREGKIFFDVLTLEESDIDIIGDCIDKIIRFR